ncbi:MAG: transposase, partial [Niameybacter sp.]
YQSELDLILTTPSMKNTFTAIGIISEIVTNMDVFPTAKHLCSCAGLTPTNNESAGKKKAIIAIARMLPTAIYKMLKNKEVYNADLYKKSNTVPIDREITLTEALSIIKAQGYRLKTS